MLSDTLQAVVTRRRVAAHGIVDLELASADGTSLPLAEPGAHIDLHLPGGLIRQYSVHDSSGKPRRYRLGVGLAEDSRGGSRYVHDSLREGDNLVISHPRNNFSLAEEARRYFFIAGGIGITPILSMIRRCQEQGQEWTLLYCVRSRGRAAYLEHLPNTNRLHLHVDDEVGGVANLNAFLSIATEGDQVYCCGPGPLMDGVAKAALALPQGAVHFEHFSAEASPQQSGKAFTVKLHRSGLELKVAADESILDAVESAGIEIPFSCREGLCRTCECRVLAGEVEHYDYVLSDEERDSNEVMMICCSRAKSAVLELDL